MRIGLAFVSAVCIAAALWAILPSSTHAVDLSRLGDTQWRDDLHYLARELPQRHANASHHVSSAEFGRLVTEIDGRIGADTADDIPIEFLKLTAAIGDAHTRVRVPKPTTRYPLRFYWFGNDLRVIATRAPAERALGKRLIAIDGKPLSEISALLHQITSQAENEWLFLQLSPLMLTRPDVLHALRIVEDVDNARYTFAADNGDATELSLAPTAEGGPWKQAYNSAPLFLQHQADAFWYTYFPDTKTVYVAFNSYDWLVLNSWKLFWFIDHHPVDKLVIDLRHNGGGDYKIGHWSLIRPIRNRPQLNQHGRLFVITGRETFSAAMNNAAQFRTETNATLIGEPPGEIPNGYQEKRSFTLPNSRLIVDYSVAKYKFLPDDAEALVPDEKVPPDWDTYRRGVDPALTRILPQ